MKSQWLKLAVFISTVIPTLAANDAQADAYIENPQGQYPVGTRSVDLIDDWRNPDPLAPEGVEGARKLNVKFWYPAKRYGCEKAKYFPQSGSYVEQFIESAKPFLPPGPEPIAELRKLNYLESYAYEDISIRQPKAWHFDQGWPVIFYSHGSSLHERDNTEMMENLASHGYMVVSINHSYVSGISEFKNGQTLYRNTAFDDLNGDAFAKVPRNMTRDTLLVYRQMKLLNRLLFDNTLDLNSVGTLGYSLGGSNAVNVCLKLRTCKAAAQLDGVQFGLGKNKPLRKPLLLIESAVHNAQFGASQALYDLQNHDTVLLTVNGTSHEDFFDITRWLGFSMSGADASHVHQLSKTNVLDFFNTYVGEVSDHYDVSYPDSLVIQRK